MALLPVPQNASTMRSQRHRSAKCSAIFSGVALNHPSGGEGGGGKEERGGGGKEGREGGGGGGGGDEEEEGGTPLSSYLCLDRCHCRSERRDGSADSSIC